MSLEEFMAITEVQPFVLECITLHIPQLGVDDEVEAASAPGSTI